MKKIKFMIIVMLVFNTISGALDIPKDGTFEIKKIKEKKILYVVHKKQQGHITNTLIKLIRFYLLEESKDYQVLFPQMTIERYNIDGEYFAIEFNGNPKITKDVKIGILKEGMFAS